MVDLVIKNGKIVSPTDITCAGIAVDKGKIVAIAGEDYLPPADKTIDAGGKYILPGVIDAHYHFGGYNPVAEACRTETVAAAAGGTTTLGCFMIAPKRSPIDVTEEWKRDFEGVSAVDYFIHAGIVDELGMNDIPRLPGIGINSFKFQVGYKGPHAELLGIRPTDDGWLYRGFDAISRLGCRPVWAQVHAENADIMLYLRSLVEKTGRHDASAWRDTRPNFVEGESIKGCIAIAEYTHCPLYVVHISIAEGIEIVKEARNRGKIELKAETCPQYLTHNSDEPIQLFKDNPALTVINPPLRDKESNQRLWEGIRDGLIDVVGSDNSFNTLAMKGNDLWKTRMAMGNLVEMVLPVMLSEGVNKGRISLQKVVEVLCFNPAKIFGLFPNKGTITVGSDADLVVVDLEKRVKVSQKDSLSACDWNIYEGWDFIGWPVMTIFRGQIIVEERKFLGPRVGRYLSCTCE